MEKIGVIGAGTMGNGIAHVFAMKGYQVNLIDVSADALKRAMATIEKNLDRMIQKEKISESDKSSTLNNITTFESLESGVIECDLVVEAATEREDLKLNIFGKLDQHCKPEAILASNTSSISITKIASATSRPEKVIGMHFMNPVPIMKLVEVINGYSTNSEVTEKIMELSKKLSKVPVKVNDYPGFVANRILMPMINEAIYTLEQGVSGVEGIDTVMKLGMAHPMGPLQLADFIGLDVCLSILDVLYDGFKMDKYAACNLLRNMVQAGKLGRKSGEGFYQYTKGSKEIVVSKQFS